MKKQQADQRKHRNQVKKLESNISQLEVQISALTKQLHTDEITEDYEKYNEMHSQIEALETKLEEFLEEWEILQS